MGIVLYPVPDGLLETGHEHDRGVLAQLLEPLVDLCGGLCCMVLLFVALSSTYMYGLDYINISDKSYRVLIYLYYHI